MKFKLVESFDTYNQLSKIVNKISNYVSKYDIDGSNQNCMLATWCLEAQLRGIDILPRPVYSPRDPIFSINGYDIVKNPIKLSISDIEDLRNKVIDAGHGARFYCHVNWSGSSGGHEFVIINDGVIKIVDAQIGKIVDLDSDTEYFTDINYNASFIVRLDDKKLNKEILKYNDEDFIVEWDDEIDSRLLEAADSSVISIEGVSSPEDLMDWMNENITYELVDDEYSNSNGVPTKTAEEVLKTGTGHCAEQSYLEKEVLDALGYDTFLVMVKENNSKKEYGAEGSAHVFLVYKEGKNYCWFEHSMQHARGIHKYTSLEALLQDVANQWWRYDENSDILEVRMMGKVITGVDTWGLAKECYKLPVKYTFDISNNIMESDVPLEEDFTQANNIEAMDKAIQKYFGQDMPGDGCVFIAPSGKFINIYPELDDHESLAYWLQEQGFEEVIEAAEWFVEAFSYVRCRDSLSQCYIELPIKNITRYQLYSLEEWLETKVSTPTLDIEAPNGEWKNYDLDEYFPEDIIKLIKRYYASGRLYESHTQKENDLVFLSDKNMNGKTLTPRVPNNFLIKNGYEDSETPRVCFARSIDGALMGLSQNLTGKDFYVHQPKNVNKKAIYKPTAKEVPDVKITGEVWYIEPVELECIGKIHVIEDDGKDGLKYTYGNNTAELYGWNWRWI